MANIIKIGVAIVSSPFSFRNIRYELGIARTPAVIGMANINTYFSEAVTSPTFGSARSFGVNAKARKVEYAIMFAICEEASSNHIQLFLRNKLA